MEDKLKIVEQIEEYLSTLPLGIIVKTSSLKKILSKTYGNPESSYIPSDYCYNSYCKGSQWDKEQILFFERLSKRGEYKYIGKNYPYSGKVFDKKNNEFGIWENGQFRKYKN